MGMRAKTQRALVQSICVAACVLVCAALARLTSNGLLATSVAASAFIAFGYPRAESAGVKCLVGGYLCGIFAGGGAGVLAAAAGANGILQLAFIALAVFVCSFSMLVLGVAHPPAAALAFTLAIDSHPVMGGLLALGAIITICLLRAGVDIFIHLPARGGDRFINAPKCVTMKGNKHIMGGRKHAGIHSAYPSAQRGGDAVRRAEKAEGVRLGRPAGTGR